jgi:LuxR family maltose regulon positive regulatory protein
MLARSLGHLAHCVALSQRALDLLPESEVAQRSSARLNLARAFLVSGDVTHASERLARDVIVPARASGNLFAALEAFTNLARLQVLQGRLRAAAATYAQAEQLAPEVSGLRVLGSASASFYIGLGDLHREWNDLERAEQYLAQAMDLIRGPLTVDADVVTQGYITLACVQQARAESGRAGTTLAELADLAHERKFAAHLIARGTAAQAHLALAQGNLPAAIAWAESSDLHAGDELTYPREAEYLTFVRVRIARARAAAPGGAAQFLDAALSLLGRLLQGAEAHARMGSVVEILILRALALQARGDLSSARQALARALMLAEPEGYIRVFVDEGPPMELLLREAQAHGIAPDYVASLLSHVRLPMLDVGSGDEPPIQNPKSQIQKLDEPLSSRELEVLRLMMAGKSNAEIAQALVIALSTVKTHTNNIYGKLGVTRRTAAIARARDLRLL